MSDLYSVRTLSAAAPLRGGAARVDAMWTAPLSADAAIAHLVALGVTRAAAGSALFIANATPAPLIDDRGVTIWAAVVSTPAPACDVCQTTAAADAQGRTVHAPGCTSADAVAQDADRAQRAAQWVADRAAAGTLPRVSGGRARQYRAGDAGSPYALRHSVWIARRAQVPFSAGASSRWALSSLGTSAVLAAGTARGAERHTVRVARDAVESTSTVLGVYWSERGRSVYVVTLSRDGVTYCDTLQPWAGTSAVAAYWDAETIAHTVAARLTADLRAQPVPVSASRAGALVARPWEA